MLRMASSLRDELKAIPRWARVAFAARCARRVEPLLRVAWPDVRSDHVAAVARAIDYAEKSAARAEADSELARGLALSADIVAERAASNTEAVARGGAYDVAHAATNAVGAVAYLKEAVSGAYYAAVDAASALAKIVGEDDTAIRADLEQLRKTARKARWTSETAVPPTFFAPLPPREAPPPRLSEDEAARIEAYRAWERAGRPSLSPADQERMYFEALDRVRRQR